MDTLTLPVGRWTRMPRDGELPFVVLNLGCGHKQDPSDYQLVIRAGDETVDAPIQLLNLDADPRVQPDLVCELGVDPIPVETESVDHVLAFHVLEHIGATGRLDEWWQFWTELYRVLKPGAGVNFECPYHTSVWAWADPTHVRAVSEFTFLYLNQDAYRVTGSAIPDYRPPFDFVLQHFELRPDTINPDVRAKEPASMIAGLLQARKPLRPYWTE